MHASYFAVAREAQAQLLANRAPQPATHEERAALFSDGQARNRGGLCAHCSAPVPSVPALGQPKGFCDKACQFRWRSRVLAATGEYTCIWCLGKDGVHNGVCPLGLCERDNWTCQLCGDPVELEQRLDHPRAVSFDHIIAEAHGGRRTWDNLRLTHMRCNSDRKCGIAGCDGSTHVTRTADEI